MKTPKDFEDSMINYGLQKLGYETAMNAVKILKAKEAFSGKLAYTRLRKRIKVAFESTTQTQNPLITELNEKVRLIVHRSKNE